MLKDFLDAFVEYKWMSLALVIAVILTVIGAYFAAKSSKKRTAERKEILAKLDYYNKLKRDFSVITQQLIDSCADDRLLFGTAANIQEKLEKESNINEAFNSLPEEKILVYVLNYVFEDSADSLSNFFRLNGKPLTPYSKRAVKELIGDEKLCSVFNKEYAMFDPDDETTSLINDELLKADDEFGRLMSENRISYLNSAADYIRKNSSVFIDAEI